MILSFHSRPVDGHFKGGGLSLPCWCIALLIRLQVIQWFLFALIEYHTLIKGGFTLWLQFKFKYRTIESLKQDLDLMTWSFHSRAVVLKSGGLSLSCWCIALFIRLLLIQWYKWYKYDTVIPICTDWISTNDLKGGFTLAIALIHIYLALPLQFLSAPQSDSYWHHRAVLLMAD